MSQRFVVVGVETANADLTSICQIGLVAFQEGKVVGVWKSLFDPEDEFARRLGGQRKGFDAHEIHQKF
jgi:DNA polymerase III subunit epsilon